MAKKEINNIILVEGKSDIKFFETLIKYQDIKNGSQNFDTIQFDEIGGSDDSKLEKAIRGLVTDLRKNPIVNLGVILDLDEFTKDERLSKIQSILGSIFGVANITFIDEHSFDLKINDKKTIEVTCHFIETDLVTNLELLLKEITTIDTIAADCLKQWYDCAIAGGRKIRKSDYLKFWREVYIRYDYCADKNLLKHSSENCTAEKSFDNLFLEDKPQAWNFDNKILDDLKTYLSTFT